MKNCLAAGAPQFLVLSFDPEQTEGSRAALSKRARAGISHLFQVSSQPYEDRTERLVWLDPRLPRHEDADGHWCTILGSVCLDRCVRRLRDPEALLRSLVDQGTSVLRDLAPPFGVVWYEEASKLVRAATDHWGLQHIYMAAGSGWAALSSSCLALSSLVPSRLNPIALGIHGLFGLYLQEATAIEGVRKLPRGQIALLRKGNVHVEPYFDALHDIGAYRYPRSKATQKGTEVLREIVADDLAACPDPGLSLSCGLDSRLIVAALGLEHRPQVRAFTIDNPSRSELACAQAVAKAAQMAHQAVSVDEPSVWSPEAAMTRCQQASFKREFAANPFSSALLDWIEDQVEQRPRFNGQNGEFARGFYYPGQPTDGPVTRERVERLARWRLRLGEGVEMDLLAPTLRDEIEAEAITQLMRTLERYSADWPTATDEFYLDVRMQRWAGTEMSASRGQRTDLSPFFDPRFVDWARAVSPQDKRTHIAYELACALDANLGRLPLDTGYSPWRMAHGGPAAFVLRGIAFTRKAAVKLQQRFLRTSHTPASAGAIEKRVLEGIVATRDSLPRVRSHSLFDPAAIDMITSGARKPNSASLALLLNVEWMLERLETTYLVD